MFLPTNTIKQPKLLPAVWIFASTEGIHKFEINDPNKGPDFISRLSGPIIELDFVFKTVKEYEENDLIKYKSKLISTHYEDVYQKGEAGRISDHLPDYIKTEQVYTGAYLLNKLWGPISKVQKEVLELFHDILAINGTRSLEFFVSKFKNIHLGEVFCSNVPLYEDFEELKRHVILLKEDDWNGKRPEDKNENLVNIVTRVK